MVLHFIYKILCQSSLAAQWIIICLPTWETWLQSLVQENFTCCKATKPVHHNCWTCVLEPRSHNYRACFCNSEAREPQLLSLCATSIEACSPESLHALQPKCHSCWARMPRACATREVRSLCTATKGRSCLRNWGESAQQRRSNAAKNKYAK